jgi:hypothetical protein
VTAIGVRSAAGAKAVVDERGRLELTDGSPPIDWYIGAVDRWHVPAEESSVRQRLIAGAPVVETRLRVPGGDAVHRVYCVADFGAAILIEIENDSPEPFAVALGRKALWCTRPPSAVAVEGIELPDAVTLVPVTHRTTVRFAVSDDPSLSAAGLGVLPAATAVAAGWRQQCEVASRWRVPDPSWEERLVTERSQLLLNGPGDRADAATYLLSAEELVRLGESPTPWVPEVAAAARRLAKSGGGGAAVNAGLRAAASVLAAAGEQRGHDDAERVRRRWASAAGPESVGDEVGVWWIHGRRSQLVTVGDQSIDLLPSWPDDWFGQGVEVYGEQLGQWRASFAVRWHGERPALLWDIDGPSTTVRCSGLDAAWSSDVTRGEALLGAPAHRRAPL